MELIKRNIGGQEYATMYKNTSKDARNVNRTRCNT